QLAPKLDGQILCLVGPPGIGKTSIGKSIARATNRKYVRISLGGIRDEAEIRGHRKTYIGSMPGRIINALKIAGSSNPVMLLDEVDKMTKDAHGDPTSALLEVLDTDQNKTFRDHFIEFPVDLSECLFIATANTTETIPLPLLDRMEVIYMDSYSEAEKISIAKNHLIPKELKRHGLKKTNLQFTDEAISVLVNRYTKESGVRNLEREIGALCRKTAKEIVSGSVKKMKIDSKAVVKMLGPEKYTEDKIYTTDEVGVVNGLAWTQLGGEMLRIEVVSMNGSGSLELTGHLGDVMKESAKAAVSYIRKHAAELNIESNFHKSNDIHIHVPEGAIPKDGPSAGITIATAIVSELTGRTVKQNVAMTGEITLTGRVLPIGGLKEKSMAALKAGIETVIIPADNKKDIETFDDILKENLKFVPVENIGQVLALALND
ncbi:endopeptidase La, partial [Eubacteriales bacterium OttesenSCG-928-G02]|nr:endopeptidase La [Eubacteriales bacterium OttesenSCG-928-G02]